MKTVDGIWSLEFYGTLGWEPRGILILNDGSCAGGARNHYSVGTYKVSGRKVHIDLDLEYFGKIRTLFGSKDRNFSVVIEGKRTGDEIEGSVTRPEKEILPLQCRLKKRGEMK